jgi:MFS family permease
MARTLNRWVVLAIIILGTTIGMMVFAAPFPLLPVWIKELGLSKAEAGLLSGLWYLPGIAVALPAGWAFDRYPVRRIMLLCWVLILAGTAVMAAAPTFVLLCAGRLLFAVGMNAHMVGAPKLVGNWFAGRKELGLAMGLYTLAFTAGVFLSLNILGRIGEARGSHPALLLLSGLSLVGMALIAAVPGTPETAAERAAAPRVGFRPWQLGAGAWILALAYFGYSIGTEAYLTFTPDLLVERGITLTAASATVGSYALIAFVLKPLLSGFLTRERALPYVVGATAAALLSIGLLFTALPPVSSAAMMGISLALGMPAFLALPTFLLPPSKAGQGYGLYQLFYSLGFFAQPAVGAVVDRTGAYAIGFVVIAAYTVLGLAVLVPAVARLGNRSSGESHAAP